MQQSLAEATGGLLSYARVRTGPRMKARQEHRYGTCLRGGGQSFTVHLAVYGRKPEMPGGRKLSLYFAKRVQNIRVLPPRCLMARLRLRSYCFSFSAVQVLRLKEDMATALRLLFAPVHDEYAQLCPFNDSRLTSGGVLGSAEGDAHSATMPIETPAVPVERWDHDYSMRQLICCLTEYHCRVVGAQWGTRQKLKKKTNSFFDAVVPVINMAAAAIHGRSLRLFHAGQVAW